MTSAGPESTRTPQRCSDAEREQASSLVREAAAEGRLTMDELEERLSVIYAARYRHELTDVSADLPSSTADTGWDMILSLAWRQLSTDLAALAGRDRASLSRRHKIVLAVALLTAVVVVVGVVSMVLHGLFDYGGPDRYYGRD